LALNNNNNNKLYTVDRNKTAFTIDFVRDNLRFQAHEGCEMESLFYE